MTKLELKDLQPEEAAFTVSTCQDRVFTLRKLTLAGRIWLEKNFDKEQISTVFQKVELGSISKIAHYLLKDEKETLEEFQELFVTQQDFVNLLQAMLKCVGVSEPMVQKIAEEVDKGNEPSLNPLIGAPSTI